MYVTPGRADDHLTVTIAGDTRSAILNAEPIIIEDGTCPLCAAKLVAQPESPEAAAAIARPGVKA